MRRIRLVFALLYLVFAVPAAAWANSGPVRWPAYPSSEILTIDRDSPVRVDREELLFDFSGDGGEDWGLSGKVSAVYQMTNPTDQPLSVQMAFPFVGTVAGLTSKDPAVLANGQSLPFQVFPGQGSLSRTGLRRADGALAVDFESIVDAIETDPYQPRSFTGGEKGRLFQIEVNPAGGREINLAADFNFDYHRTKILTDGFNRYERDGEKTRIAAWCGQPAVLEIFVLGPAPEFNLTAYTDGGLQNRAESADYRVTSREMDINTYVSEHLLQPEAGPESAPFLPPARLLDLYQRALDDYFFNNMGYCALADLAAEQNSERILTLIYNVDFMPGSRQEVAVRYRASGGMDRSRTTKPMYTFSYILNPARYWQDFQNLHITLRPPRKAPYVVKSSVPFQKRGGDYTVSLAALPKQDLSFTLYAHQNLTFADRMKSTVFSITGFRVLKWGGLLIILLILGRAWVAGKSGEAGRPGRPG